MPIKSIKARQIFDSRGNPTVEVDLVSTATTIISKSPSLIFYFTHSVHKQIIFFNFLINLVINFTEVSLSTLQVMWNLFIS